MMACMFGVGMHKRIGPGARVAAGQSECPVAADV